MQATTTSSNSKASSVNRANLGTGSKSQQFQTGRFAINEKKANSATFSNRFLTLKFNPIGSIKVKSNLGIIPRKGVKNLLKGLLNECLPFIGKIPNGTITELAELLNKTLTDISKQIDCQFTVEKYTEDNREDFYTIVFYRECKTYYYWYLPRLAFLRKLETENIQWFGAAVDAIRYITEYLGIDPATDNSSVTEYLSERLECEDDMEEEERELLTPLLESYEEGQINELFKLIKQQPVLELTDLVTLIESLPEYPFKQSLLSALMLCIASKQISQYDYTPNADRFEDHEPLRLEYQYSWIYDYDAVFNEIELENNSIAREWGCEDPHTYFVLKGVQDLTPHEIISKIKERVIDDTFPDDFNLSLKNLCDTITNYLENEPA